MVGDEKTGSAGFSHLEAERQPPDRTSPPMNKLAMENSDFIQIELCTAPLWLLLMFPFRHFCHITMFVQRLYFIYSVHRG